MADNYLERQQENYEARKAAWKNSKKNIGKKRKKQHGNDVNPKAAYANDHLLRGYHDSE